MHRIVDAVWKIALGIVIGLGLVLVPFAACQGQGLRQEQWPPPPFWGEGPLPAGGIELEVVTATVEVEAGAVLTYTDPYTAVVEVPAGAVTETTLITLTSLMVPRHPPTPPWTAAWVGQAFELRATGSLSKPVTATIHHYPEPARWVLLRWEASASQWTNTPTTLDRDEGLLVSRIYQMGEFAVYRAACHFWLPVMARGGTL